MRIGTDRTSTFMRAATREDEIPFTQGDERLNRGLRQACSSLSGRTIFNRRNNAIHIRASNGHFYPVPGKNVESSERPAIDSIRFTKEGLENLRRKYDAMHGAPSFMHSFLKLDNSQRDLRQALMYPQFFPYFEPEQFLITPNLPYDPNCEYLSNPRSQKLKDKGITLNAWFIHPDSSCIQEKSRQLLSSLSNQNDSGMKFIEFLRKELETDQKGKIPSSAGNGRDVKTIAELKRNGGYLASILDLDGSHIDLLKNLKEKSLKHLRDQYGVFENDDASLYFHFPYDEDSVTLHLHIRVNHGLHPLEANKSFTLDEIVSGLSARKNIDQIILEKQEKNGGKMFKHIPDHEKLYESTDGVIVTKNDTNACSLSGVVSKIVTRSFDDSLINSWSTSKDLGSITAVRLSEASQG